MTQLSTNPQVTDTANDATATQPSPSTPPSTIPPPLPQNVTNSDGVPRNSAALPQTDLVKMLEHCASFVEEKERILPPNQRLHLLLERSTGTESTTTSSGTGKPSINQNTLFVLHSNTVSFQNSSHNGAHWISTGFGMFAANSPVIEAPHNQTPEPHRRPVPLPPPRAPLSTQSQQLPTSEHANTPASTASVLPRVNVTALPQENASSQVAEDIEKYYEQAKLSLINTQLLKWYHLERSRERSRHLKSNSSIRVVCPVVPKMELLPLQKM